MEKKVKILITYENGLHARPVTKLVDIASRFDCDLFLENKGITINMKSVLGVMTLGVYNDEEIVIIANGNDADAALKSLVNFITSDNLGEVIQ